MKLEQTPTPAVLKKEQRNRLETIAEKLSPLLNLLPRGDLKIGTQKDLHEFANLIQVYFYRDGDISEEALSSAEKRVVYFEQHHEELR